MGKRRISRSKLGAYKHIIFGAEHYNPLGIVRSLGETGLETIGIILRNERKITSASKYMSKCHYVDTVEEGYKILISKYGNESRKPFIYSSDDTIAKCLDEHFEELKDKFYFFNANQAGYITFYMNKRNISDLAEKNGLNVLPYIVVIRGEIPKNIEYPVVTKAESPDKFGWKQDSFVCHNEEELCKAYAKIRSERVFIQRFIEKKNEYCLEGLSVNHGKDARIAILSTYDYLIENSYSPYMTVRNFNNEKIQIPLMRMLKQIQYEGIFETEFLIDKNNKLWFSEINFRNSTWSYACTCLGMNLPVYWAYGMLEGRIKEGFKKAVPDSYHAMVELTDFKIRVLGRRIKLFKWIWEFIYSECHYYLGRYGDIKPFVNAIFSSSKRRLGSNEKGNDK